MTKRIEYPITYENWLLLIQILAIPPQPPCIFLFAEIYYDIIHVECQT